MLRELARPAAPSAEPFAPLITGNGRAVARKGQVSFFPEFCRFAAGFRLLRTVLVFVSRHFPFRHSRCFQFHGQRDRGGETGTGALRAMCTMPVVSKALWTPARRSNTYVRRRIRQGKLRGVGRRNSRLRVHWSINNWKTCSSSWRYNVVKHLWRQSYEILGSLVRRHAAPLIVD
jgi:hypothetical protein